MKNMDSRFRGNDDTLVAILVPFLINNLAKKIVHTEQDVAIVKNPSTHPNKKRWDLHRMNMTATSRRSMIRQHKKFFEKQH